MPLTNAISPVTTGNDTPSRPGNPSRSPRWRTPARAPGTTATRPWWHSGTPAPRPLPRANRNANNSQNPRASGVSAVTTLHHSAANVNAFPRAHLVGEPARREHRPVVRPEERAEDQALLGVAQVEVQIVLDERQRDAEVRAIQVIQ